MQINPPRPHPSNRQSECTVERIGKERWRDGETDSVNKFKTMSWYLPEVRTSCVCEECEKEVDQLLFENKFPTLFKFNK